MKSNSELIVQRLKEVIFSETIIQEFKMSDSDFTRNRKQPFGSMILFMVNFLKKSLIIEIDNYLSHVKLKLEDCSFKSFTSSAFVQKRKKINHTVFKFLSAVIIDNFYIKSNKNIKLFEGFRLLAVDGSRTTLPNSKELQETFGRAKNQTEAIVVQGRVSIIYDVLNHIVIDSVLSNLKIAERELALGHSEHWKPKDLIIYDRGYPSFDFKYQHTKKGIDYLMRVPVEYSKVVMAFVDSKKTSVIVTISPPDKHNYKDKDYTKSATLQVRLVRVELPDGEIEILFTSLLDNQLYPASIFKELYFLRWGVETFYDQLKNKLKLENFTGYSASSVLQDFYCSIFISNLQSVIVNDLQAELDEKSAGKLYKQKVNTNLSYGFLKNRVLELLWKDIPGTEIHHELKTLFLRNTIPIRNGRHEERNRKKYQNRNKPKVTKNQRDAI